MLVVGGVDLLGYLNVVWMFFEGCVVMLVWEVVGIMVEEFG